MAPPHKGMTEKLESGCLMLIKFGCTKMMTNTDNLESSLLTFNLLKICSVTSCTCRAVEFCPL